MKKLFPMGSGQLLWMVDSYEPDCIPISLAMVKLVDNGYEDDCINTITYVELQGIESLKLENVEENVF
jgi:hypothetical protein